MSTLSSRNGIFAKNWRFDLLDKVKSADIRKFLNIESLLLRLEISQLRWTCDTNVPRKNCQITVLFNTDWSTA